MKNLTLLLLVLLVSALTSCLRSNTGRTTVSTDTTTLVYERPVDLSVPTDTVASSVLDLQTFSDSLAHTPVGGVVREGRNSRVSYKIVRSSPVGKPLSFTVHARADGKDTSFTARDTTKVIRINQHTVVLQAKKKTGFLQYVLHPKQAITDHLRWFWLILAVGLGVVLWRVIKTAF